MTDISRSPSVAADAAIAASVRRFRLMSTLEAWSWAGLLVGMFFKYVVIGNEIGVKIMGPIHGILFVAYIIVGFHAATLLRWPLSVRLLAFAAAFPPFCTVWFERWAERRGYLGQTG